MLLDRSALSALVLQCLSGGEIHDFIYSHLQVTKMDATCLLRAVGWMVHIKAVIVDFHDFCAHSGLIFRALVHYI